MPRSRDKVKSAIMSVLQSLSEEERRLLGEVMRLEAQNLHLRKPQIKEDLVKVVRQVITQ